MRHVVALTRILLKDKTIMNKILNYFNSSYFEKDKRQKVPDEIKVIESEMIELRKKKAEDNKNILRT